MGTTTHPVTTPTHPEDPTTAPGTSTTEEGECGCARDSLLFHTDGSFPGEQLLCTDSQGGRVESSGTKTVILPGVSCIWLQEGHHLSANYISLYCDGCRWRVTTGQLGG